MHISIRSVLKLLGGVLACACIVVALRAVAPHAPITAPDAPLRPTQLQAEEGVVLTEGGRWPTLVTPWYYVTLPEWLIPDDYVWEYNAGAAEGLPEKASRSLTVFDARTGELSFAVYCYPRDPHMPQFGVTEDVGAAEGLSLYSRGACQSQTELGVALALPEGAPEIAPLAISVIGNGSLVRIEGIDPYGFPSQAYLAHATDTDDGVRIETPLYAVDIPGYKTRDLSGFYRHLDAGKLDGSSCVLDVMFPDGSAIQTYISLRPATPTNRDYQMTRGTGVKVEGGLEVYVLAIGDDARKKAKEYAGWVSAI